MAAPKQPRIAVLLPCFNEEATIAETVAGFRRALPGAAVYVYDNNSRDRTSAVAAKAGAVVRAERQQGKGHVVRRMFADIDADVYLMADGDLTYDPASAPRMVELLVADSLDMVVGTRKHDAAEAYRGGHVLGNRLFTRLLAKLLRQEFHRYFLWLQGILKTLCEEFPGALLGLRDRDRDERPRARAADAGRRGRDPLPWPAPKARIPSCRPFATDGGSSGPSPPSTGSSGRRCSSASSGRCCSSPPWCCRRRCIVTYVETGLVPRLPTAILVTGMVIVAVLCFFAGLILDTVTRGRREMRRLAYLALAGPAGPAA